MHPPAAVTSSMFRILSSAISIRCSASSSLVLTMTISSFIISNCSLFSWQIPLSLRRISSMSAISTHCTTLFASLNLLAANCCCAPSFSPTRLRTACTAQSGDVALLPFLYAFSRMIYLVSNFSISTGSSLAMRPS